MGTFALTQKGKQTHQKFKNNLGDAIEGAKEDVFDAGHKDQNDQNHRPISTEFIKFELQRPG